MMLYNANCIDILPQIDSIDFVFTDPPYGIDYHNNKDLASRRGLIQKEHDFNPELDHKPIENDGDSADIVLSEALHIISDKLVPGGFLCCCAGGAGPDPVFVRWIPLIKAHLDMQDIVVWDKQGCPGLGWLYRRNYEVIIVAEKKGKSKWYDDSNRIVNIIRHIENSQPRNKLHPAEKPVELAQFFINLHTQQGDTVVDPFMGCGTTGVAAVKMGRKFIGIEIDPKHYETAQRRIDEAERQGVLLDVY